MDKQTHGVSNKWVKSHLRRVKSPPPLSPPSSLRSHHIEDNYGAVPGMIERERVEWERVKTVEWDRVERGSVIIG